MLHLTAADYDEALDRVEADLSELGGAFDRGVIDGLFETAALALGIRARSLFLGFVRLIRTDVPVAALALMRPTIEINLTLRFLVANPQLHTELWMAEGERQAAVIVGEIERTPELLAKAGDEAPPPEWHFDRRAYVEGVRARALAAGVRGVPRNDRASVMPSMRSIAYDHGDQATKEAYTFAYRSLSHAIHGSSRAFDHGYFVPMDGGRLGFQELTDPGYQIRRHRALNAATFASTLCVLSGPLELDVFEHADMIRGLLMTISLEEEGTDAG